MSVLLFLALNVAVSATFDETLEYDDDLTTSRYSYQRPIIGIDLGTTYTSVGVFHDEQVVILLNDQGKRITPSVVAFTKTGERLIGDFAKSQVWANRI